MTDARCARAREGSEQAFVELPDFDTLFPPERRSGRPRVNDVRSDYFDGQLDLDRSYWLGFIYADGSVSFKPRWTLTINLAAKDEEHLRNFHAAIGGRVSRTHAGAIRLLVHSRDVCLGLGRLGVLPRKSYAPAAPPALTGSEHQAFLRGLFDGDGCLHVNKRGTLQAAFCGHPATVTWFVEQLGITPNGAPRLRGGTSYAQWTSPRTAPQLASQLYAGPGPRLNRKSQLADRFMA